MRLDDARIAKHRVPNASFAHQRAGVGHGRPRARRGFAALQNDHRLACRPRLVERGQESRAVRNTLEIRRDDAGVAILDQRVQVVAGGQHGLVAGTDHVAKAEARLLRERLRHRRRSAALADHRDIAAHQLVDFGQERREARDDGHPAVDDADAIGPGEREPRLPTRVDEFALQQGAALADFGEAAGPRDAAAYPRRGALAHERRQRIGGRRKEREVGGYRKVPNARVAGDAVNFGAARIDRPQRSRIAEFLRQPDGDAAEISRLVRRADHGDRARCEEPGDVGEVR